MTAAIRAAWEGLRARPGRALLAAAGVAAAAAMLGTATTVSYGLATGFDRAAETADLPDVIARFEDEELATVDERVRALPNLESRSYRYEVKGVGLVAGANRTGSGAVHVVREGRRGYAIVAGRDLESSGNEVVIERGLAEEWNLELGSTIAIETLGEVRVVGIAVSPDNVAFPLASAARVYLSSEGLTERFGAQPGPVNLALVWTRDPSRLDSTLVQARAVSFGLDDLRFLTSEGIRLQVEEAAGIVIALLIAFSLVALVVAGVTLGASARAEVQRRLELIGLLRAIGFSRREVAGRYGVEAVLVSLPSGALGLAVGTLAAYGPSSRLLASLNELAPGAALVAPLGACLLLVVAVVTLATLWPAWRASSAAPAELLRGAELRASPRRLPWPGGFLGLGMRLVAARPVRTGATVVVLAASTALVLLMLSLATRLESLRDDPISLGKRYQLTALLDPDRVPEAAAVPGVAAAAPRYEVEAADSYQLGETLRLIAFPGDHTTFESPPLADGRRLTADAEAEIGVGLAEALGARPGSTLAVQLPTGAEVRFEVVGVVRALGNAGRVAYVRPQRLLAAGAMPDTTVAIRLEPGADRAAVTRDVAALGGRPEATRGATTDSGAFLAVLADVLRVVAVVNGLIALFVLAQALALTALERRGSLAILRASGAGSREIALVLGGAAALIAGLGCAIGVFLERVALGPAVARLAASYVDLPLAAGLGQIAAVAVALSVLALAATLWVARRTRRVSIVAGLREE